MAYDDVRDHISSLNLGSLRTLINNPSEFVTWLGLLRSKVRKDRLDYGAECEDRPKRLASVLETSESEIRGYQEELDNAPWIEDYHKRLEELDDAGVISGTTSQTDSETLYCVVRATKPLTVVETGVLYGSFDAYILAALEKNGMGELHSIDLPGGTGSGYEYGHLIPDEFEHCWNLHLEDVHDILPSLLSRLEPIDLFLHDSDHSKDHMKWEYSTAYPYLDGDGILASHDVLASTVFQEFCEEKMADYTRVANAGVGRKAPTSEVQE